MRIVEETKTQEEQVGTKGQAFMEKEKIESLKRKAEVIKEISLKSAKAQLKDPRTITYAAAVCLYQGLKYKGSFRRGMRAGLATIAAFVGSNVATSLVQNSDEIKKA